MTITHRIRFNILAKDVEESVRFYQRIAGMIEVETHTWLRVLTLPGDTHFELGLIDEVSEFVPRAARGIAEGAYLTLLVDNVSAAVQAAFDEGVEIVEEPRGDAYLAHAVIRDPNGVVIELATPAAINQRPPVETIA